MMMLWRSSRRRLIEVVLLVCFVMLETCCFANARIMTERRLLEEFYNATTGGDWVNATNWNTEHPICTWHGVVCRSPTENEESPLETLNSRVTGLQLAHNGLTGTLPAALYQLPALALLDLAGNNLQAANFEFLNDSAAPLQQVDLRQTRVMDVQGLEKAAATLQTLDLRNTPLDLDGFLSDILPALTNLWHVRLQSNRNPHGTTLPTSLASLTDLHELTMANSNLQGSIPAQLLASWIKLQELNLSNNRLTGTLPTLELDALVNLQVLNLAGLEFTHSQHVQKLTGPLPTLSQAPRLQYVSLAHQQFTGTLPRIFLDATTAAAAASSDKSDHGVFVDLSDNPALTGSLPAAPLDRLDALHLQLTQTGFTGPLPETWCRDTTKGRWMNGLVALYGCNAILCPPGTYNLHGQQQSERDPCVPCPVDTDAAAAAATDSLLGRTDCSSSNNNGSSNSQQEQPQPPNEHDKDGVGNNDGDATTTTSSSNIRKAETVRILAQIYLDLDGPNSWHDKRGWDVLDTMLQATKKQQQGARSINLDAIDWSGVTYCDGHFHGVLCDKAGQVQVLQLSNNGLTGTIPARLFQLSGLEALDLSYNPVQLDAAGGWEGLPAATSLRRLQLSNTDIDTLRGIAAAGAAGVPLQELYLDGTDLQEAPTELFALTGLQTLRVEGSYLTGTLASAELAQMTSLVSLSLQQNRLSGTIPGEALAKLTALQYLDLSDNDWQGELPAELNQMSSIISLRINRARGGLGGQLLSFDKLERIHELELSSNVLTGSIPSTFFFFFTSKTDPLIVRLDGNQLEGIVPVSLRSFSDVRLELQDNKITGIPPELCAAVGDDWMDGQVGKMGAENKCNAILCPPGTWNAHGRARSNQAQSCQACEGNKYFGETACETTGLESNSEVEILDKLYAATGGRYWQAAHTNWTKPGVPLCYREGVVCGWPTPDMNWGVTELRLEGFGLRGTVPTEVFELPRLRVLSLPNNEIDLSFQGIENAKILEIVNLGKTKLTSLAGFHNAGEKMYELHIEGNEMEGEFPSSILETKTLRRLFIGGNNFNSTIPTEIGLLTDLSALSLHSNDFTGPLPSEIGNIQNLQVLDAHKCKLSGLLPNELGDLWHLRHLSLYAQRSEAKFHGPVLPFSTNPDLTFLFLSLNELEGTIPDDFLARANRTAHLAVDLSYNEISGSIPSQLGDFLHLNLDVVANEISHIPPELCDNLGWMNGAVELVAKEDRCDAIMCPPGTVSKAGRLMDANSKCESCSLDGQAPYYGSLSCLDKESLIERELLTEFFKITDGDRWHSADNWLSDSHACTWFGVDCNEKFKVVSIKLENNRLDNKGVNIGMLHVLSRLRHLKELHLKGNEIKADFENIEPDWPLETLHISATGHTSLKGIGRMKALKSLHAADNELSGELPSELYEMTALEQVYLSFNKLNGTISSSISSLVNLQELYLFDNLISGVLPEQLGQDLPQLKELVLAENRLQGGIPVPLTKHPVLEQLQLQNQKGRDVMEGQLPDFSEAVNLWYLDLSGNRFSGEITEDFLKNSIRVDESVYVGLQNNRIEGSIPKKLERFDSLTLELGGNSITSIPKVLCKKHNWMNGAVKHIGSCDAILCPAGTYSPSGRQVSRNDPCSPCETLALSPTLGHTICRKGDSERGILQQLFAQCGGSKWEDHGLWSGDDPICSWEGVHCEGDKDDDEGVVTLHLENIGMVGTLPHQIWALPQLRKLNVRYNAELHVLLNGMADHPPTALESLELTGARVESISGISTAVGLRELDFSGVGGVFPREIFELSNLERLFLADNMFLGTLPHEISGLTSLRRLTLTGSDFHFTIPSNYGRLSYLQELVLDENLLSGTIPDTLSFLKHLTRFSVSRKSKAGPRKLSGPLPPFDKNPELVTLALDGNQISGTIPKNFLAASLSIETVDLSSNRISGVVPSELDSLSGLSLLLTNNQISELPDVFCNNNDWMGGVVGDSCNAILCPPGTENPLGRATNASTTCEACPYSTFYGSTMCAAPVNERDVLLKFYQAVGGDEWTRNDFWTSTTAVCDWYGVGCDPDGHVVLLNLQDNNLRGKLDGGDDGDAVDTGIIFSLPRLQVLWLGLNPSLEVSLHNIGQANELRELKLDSMGLVSLTGIGAAKGLTLLDVQSNALAGEFPPELLHLSNLRVLEMSHNRLSGALPSSVSMQSLEQLRVLDLKDNRFAGDVPSFNTFRVLSEMDLSENRFGGTLPDEFLSQLAANLRVRVNLTGNLIDPEFPDSLGRFDDIEVDLGDGKIFHTGDRSGAADHTGSVWVVCSTLLLVAWGWISAWAV